MNEAHTLKLAYVPTRPPNVSKVPAGISLSARPMIAAAFVPAASTSARTASASTSASRRSASSRAFVTNRASAPHRSEKRDERGASTTTCRSVATVPSASIPHHSEKRYI